MPRIKNNNKNEMKRGLNIIKLNKRKKEVTNWNKKKEKNKEREKQKHTKLKKYNKNKRYQF